MLYSTKAGLEVPVTRQSVVTLMGTNKWRWLFSTLSASSKLELFTKGNGYHNKSLWYWIWVDQSNQPLGADRQWSKIITKSLLVKGHTYWQPCRSDSLLVSRLGLSLWAEDWSQPRAENITMLFKLEILSCVGSQKFDFEKNLGDFFGTLWEILC